MTAYHVRQHGRSRMRRKARPRRRLDVGFVATLPLIRPLLLQLVLLTRPKTKI